MGKNEFKILELFSGIGGMHYAFNYSGLQGKIMAAVDINPVANAVYSHNYPEVKILNNNIQNLTPKYIDKLEVNLILMSPPCQPFTRVGNQKDVDDNRTDALKHICDILSELESVEYVLMENVKGFETSRAREKYLQALKDAGYFYRELILSPSQFGVPNSRHRYYCLARKTRDFEFEGGRIWSDLPGNEQCVNFAVKTILEEDSEDVKMSLIKDEVLKKRISLLDIVTPNCTSTNCFTKAYTHYSEGTGSVLTPHSKEGLQEMLDQLSSPDITSDKAEILRNSCNLRYFTPREVARLMSFPENFTFPPETTTKQKYRLLGNSINVKVVGLLIKLLCSTSASS